VALISPTRFEANTLLSRRSAPREISELGNRIALSRECLELSPQQLSDATGRVVSRRTIIALESGRRADCTLTELIALARALEVLPHELSMELEHYYG
jgi:transcriptional regulator with XRE-family HTH domain